MARAVDKRQGERGTKCRATAAQDVARPRHERRGRRRANEVAARRKARREKTFPFGMGTTTAARRGCPFAPVHDVRIVTRRPSRVDKKNRPPYTRARGVGGGRSAPPPSAVTRADVGTRRDRRQKSGGLSRARCDNVAKSARGRRRRTGVECRSDEGA